MTVAEQLRQEGEQRGIKEGELKRAKEVARKAIIKGYSVEDIIDLTDLTEKEIEDIRKEMLKS